MILKCGQVAGGLSVISFPIGASEVFKDISGHFVVPDGSGRVEIAGATDTDILGWALQGERTASSTEGNDKCDVNTAYDAVYEMPAILNAGTAPTEAQLIAAVGETCDIKMVSTNYQYANINTGSIDILLIVGYKYYGSAVGQQTVYVKVNVAKLVFLDVAGA